jgi:beta-galactosidase beta subunit
MEKNDINNVVYGYHYKRDIIVIGMKAILDFFSMAYGDFVSFFPSFLKIR